MKDSVAVACTTPVRKVFVRVFICSVLYVMAGCFWYNVGDDRKGNMRPRVIFGLCALTAMCRLFVFLAGMLAAVPALALEWQLAETGECHRVVSDSSELRFPGGFKATVRFACDLSKIGERSNHANLFCKGKGFHDGYCAMVRKDGRLLVDIKGIEPQYYVSHALTIESMREHLLELYVTPTCVRIFLDGAEKEAYPFVGKLGYADVTAPLKLGSMGGYTFHGRLPLVRLEPLSDVQVPPGGPKPLVTVAPKHQPLADILWTKPICLEKGRYIGWPTAVVTKKGTVIAAFSGDRDAHVCPWGKVQIVRSEDGGETWSEPLTAVNSPLDDRDCGMVQLPDGEVLVIWVSCTSWNDIKGFKTRNYAPTSREFQWRQHTSKIEPETIRRYGGIWCIRSRDEGKTWSKPEKLGTMAAFTPHGPVLLKDGSLFQIGRTYFTEPERRNITRITTMRSTDGGHVWEALCHALPDMNGENSKPQMFHEPHAIELKDGRLLAVIRYHGDDNCMRQSFSSDGGKTWTPMAKTPMLGLPPHLLRLQDGRILCTFGRRFAQPTGFGEYACISSDEGQTWDVEHEIFLSAHTDGDLGYPSTVQLANGDLLTVYYQPVKSHELPCLMATKWRLKINP